MSDGPSAPRAPSALTRACALRTLRGSVAAGQPAKAHVMPLAPLIAEWIVANPGDPAQHLRRKSASNVFEAEEDAPAPSGSAVPVAAVAGAVAGALVGAAAAACVVALALRKR